MDYDEDNEMHNQLNVVHDSDQVYALIAQWQTDGCVFLQPTASEAAAERHRLKQERYRQMVDQPLVLQQSSSPALVPPILADPPVPRNILISSKQHTSRKITVSLGDVETELTFDTSDLPPPPAFVQLPTMQETVVALATLFRDGDRSLVVDNQMIPFRYLPEMYRGTANWKRYKQTYSELHRIVKWFEEECKEVLPDDYRSMTSMRELFKRLQSSALTKKRKDIEEWIREGSSINGPDGNILDQQSVLALKGKHIIAVWTQQNKRRKPN
jgi:hypothetical protein